MKQSLHLQVPVPCHEDWNKMNPVQKGRFCASCAKQVVDFTLMSDAEILSHLQRSKGNTCGRFSNDQLNRALEEPRKEKSKYWQWLFTCISSLLLINKSNAQVQGKIKMPPPVTIAPSEKKENLEEVIIVGGLRPSKRIAAPEPRIVSGKIIDGSGTGIPGATIMVTGTKNGTLADGEGNFSIRMPGNMQTYTLKVSSVGFSDKDIRINRGNEKLIPKRIELTEQVLGGIDIISFPVKKVQLTGKIIDEKTKQPVPYADIYTGNHIYAGQANEKGKFDITVAASGNDLILEIEALGYENENGKIKLNDEEEAEVFVTMTQKITELPEVTLISYTVKGRLVPIGCGTRTTKASTVSGSTQPDKPIDMPVTVAPATTGISIYPNPALRNSMISIVIPEKDRWQILLTDNNGTVLKTQQVTVPAKKTAVAFQVPGQIAGGIYFIRLINLKGENTYTGKILVQ
jgi:hypothetical protein